MTKTPPQQMLTGVVPCQMHKVNMSDYHDICSKNTPKEERKKKNIGDIWLNSVRCKVCGDIIRSKNRHDYVECHCGAISVDGGSWYLRRVGNLNNYEELSEMFDDAKEEK